MTASLPVTFYAAPPAGPGVPTLASARTEYITVHDPDNLAAIRAALNLMDVPTTPFLAFVVHVADGIQLWVSKP